MRTIPRHRDAAPRQRGTTELSAARLRALVREMRKRPTTNLEVEMIREPASGSVDLDGVDAMVPLDSGDPLPAGSRTKLERDALVALDDGDPISGRTRIDRDALPPLRRPSDAVDPIHPRRVSPALLVGLVLGIAAYLGFWLLA